MFRYSVIFLLPFTFVLSACTKEEIQDNFMKGAEKCQVISYNAPHTGYKTFYEKKLNVLGRPVFIYARIAGVFGDTENYKLDVQYLNPTQVRIKGYYTGLEHWIEEDVVDEPAGFGDEENIFWDVFLDSSTHFIKHLINRKPNPGDQDTILSIFYSGEKISEAETYWNGRWWFRYDSSGNLETVGTGPDTYITISYSRERAGKLLSYEPFSRGILVEFTLMDMLGWLPLRSNYQRNQISDDNTYTYQDYNNHQFDADGKLIGWNEGSQNIWECRTSKVKLKENN